MINLILGQPGGGKSHEAVVYHVVPALNQGRKVITNLALDMEQVQSVFPGVLASDRTSGLYCLKFFRE
ncbi:zonular occludens toxin domain-containing protein [Pseudomonas aeruginosa]|uniref:zonular occludens toxin domain-containing protein n=1 Tax=Pseudomonas aeruginosa TaxID=287 RepID=UPI003593D2FA